MRASLSLDRAAATTCGDARRKPRPSVSLAVSLSAAISRAAGSGARFFYLIPPRERFDSAPASR